MRSVIGVLAALVLALTAPSALGRTVYTVAGGGSLPPRGAGPEPLATSVALSGVASVEALPSGDFLIKVWRPPEFRGELYRVGIDGRMRPIADQVVDFAGGPDGSVYYTRLDVLTWLTPDGRRRDIARVPPSQPGLFGGMRMSVTSDGTVLFTVPELHQILRVAPSGTLVPAAGNGSNGFSGDGGPATSAALSMPHKPSATADGGFLFWDSGTNRVRKVGPDGVIRTVAGGRRGGSTRDGTPAVKAPMDYVYALAALPHGGFAFVSQDYRLRRVTRDGVIDTIARNRPPQFNAPRVGFLGGDGDAARNMLFDAIGSSLSATDDGGLLLGANGVVRLLASPRAQHPALAFRVTLPSRRRVSYTVTSRARVRLQVLGEGRTMQLHTTSGPGRDRFRLPRRLPSGGYELRLTAVTHTGVRLTRRIGMLLVTRLPVRAARAVVTFDDDHHSIVTPRGIDLSEDRENISKAGRCKRFGRRRVDCEAVRNRRPHDCFGIISTSLDRRGQVWVGEYDSFTDDPCAAGFSRHPDWEDAQHERNVPLIGLSSRP